MDRIPLPTNVLKDMRSYRASGGYRTPESYRHFHRLLAVTSLEKMKASGIEVHRTWDASDGWGDHHTTWAIIELPGGVLKKIHWHDGNQEFFESHTCGGSSPLRLK